MDNNETQQNNNAHMAVFPWSYESPEEYAKADAYIWCRSCNHDTKIGGDLMTNVEGGLSIDPLTTNNKSSLALACEKCGSQLVLHFRKSEETDDAETDETPEGDPETIVPTESNDDTTDSLGKINAELAKAKTNDEYYETMEKLSDYDSEANVNMRKAHEAVADTSVEPDPISDYNPAVGVSKPSN